MKKRVFYTEAAYAAGLLLLAFGTALTEFGGFGISMVVAPAYILHLKLSEFFSFFSFGMAEYVLQGAVLLGMILLIRKVKLTYFLSFATTVLYGFSLDGAMTVVALLPVNMVTRIAAYLLGVPTCAAGVSLLFQTYLPPEAYELFVKEAAQKLRMPIPLVKTVYDCCSMAVALGMSLAFFGEFRGIGIGSVICAFLNGTLIRMFTSLFAQKLTFCDRFPLRARFEESEEKL